MQWIGKEFCLRCGKPLTDSGREYCDDCRKRPHYFVQGRSMLSYRGAVRSSLYRLKYANRKEYARTYGEAMAEQFGDWIRRCGIQVIVPIPLHGRRKRERGYNQAALLADVLGDKLGIPVEEKLLVRVKRTDPQKNLSGSQRKGNMEHAFRARFPVPDGSRILLVDDIYTTGSTVDAASKCLLSAGKCRIYVLTVAIGG